MKLPGNGSQTNFRTFLSFALSYILMWGLIPAIAIADAIRSLYTQERDSGYVVVHSIEDSNELAAHVSETVLASLSADASNVDKLSAAFHAIADVVVISDEAPEDPYEALVSALHGQATTADGATQAFVLVVNHMGFESEVAYEEGRALARVHVDDVWLRTNVAASILARMEAGATVAEETWLVEENEPALEAQEQNQNAIEVQDEAIVSAPIVQDDEEALLTAQAKIGIPAPTTNVSEYIPYSNDCPRTSFLHVNASGELERVEFIYDSFTVAVETLSPSFEVTSQRIIPRSAISPKGSDIDDLVWGGFYSGEQYNYIATGQKNNNKDDSTVVFRVTKFPKNWDTSRAMSLDYTNGQDKVYSNSPLTIPNKQYGTINPFAQGNCDMEEHDGMLHLRTSHILYNGHQGTAHLVIRESSMTVADSMTYGQNRYDTKYGYVTHSFAQRLAKLNGTMYGLDLGDATPRSIAIKKLGVTNNTGDVLQIMGDATLPGGRANNFTGVTLGGFESSASANSLIITGATMDQAAHKDRVNYKTAASPFAPRNAFVAIVNPANTIAKPVTVNTLTHYAYSGNKGADLTKLVKIDDNRFLVVWSEMNCWANYAAWDETNQTGTLGYVFVDARGNTLGSVRSMAGYLSECDPVLFGDKVVWYTEDMNGGSAPVYYTIDANEGGTNAGSTTGDNQAAGATESIQDVTVASIGNQTYTGKEIMPAISVSHKGSTLKQNIDYRVTYQNNTNVTNDATVVIEGVGNYTGTKKVSFKIVAAAISSVVPSTSSYTYDGTEKKPGVTVKAGSLVVPSSSYDVVYSNNKQVGTATITVTGKGNYTGTKTAEFKITAGQGSGTSTSTITFVDVNQSTAHYEDIVWMATSGISQGWTNADGTRSFRPIANVTRGDMAAFLFRLAKNWGLVDESWKASNTSVFTDVNSSTAHNREIWWLAEEGISAGWVVSGGKKEFRPANTVARADMAAFLFRLAKKKNIVNDSWKPTNTSVFIDVNASTAHNNDIWWLAEKGISAGWSIAGGKKEFRPFNTVARADLAAFLHRLDNQA